MKYVKFKNGRRVHIKGTRHITLCNVEAFGNSATEHNYKVYEERPRKRNGQFYPVCKSCKTTLRKLRHESVDYDI